MVTNTTSLRRCIEEVSLKNTEYTYPEQAINQAESLKSLSSDLYTDNIRFIYELIQNADDAQAKHIFVTILENEYLIITHDGKGIIAFNKKKDLLLLGKEFNTKDLQGLCGINNGTKKKDLDKTGYKGLGFKAVFGKSNRVIIYSNGEYFQFDSSHRITWRKEWKSIDQETWEKENDRQFTYPWQINPIWTNKQDVPHFLVKFLESKQKDLRVAYAILLHNVVEIHSAISQLKQHAYMFLFLRNISCLTLSTGDTDTISIDRDLGHDLKKVYINRIVDSQWIIKRSEIDIPSDVIDRLSNDAKAPDKLRFTRQAEMFLAAKYKDSTANAAGGIEKLREQDSILFSYLPTNIRDYKFPVLINANFLTNVNREQIHTDSIWNQWLFSVIGDQILQWIKQLVREKKFRCQAYQLIPSKLNLTDNVLSEEFNKSFEMSIKQCNFILNRKNELLKVNEVIMDSTSMSKQPSFINLNAMRQYIVESEESPSEYATNPFTDYDSNLSRIGVKEFTWIECIDMLKSDIFLQTFSIEDNKRMIQYFYRRCTKNTDDPIEKIPFLMDQHNRLQSIKSIYFPAETIGDSGTIDSDDLFLHKSIFSWLNEKNQREIKQWLKNIGVEERTDLAYFRKTIIPNASSYITLKNAISTIKILFTLFRKNAITKKELEDLKKLKLLTTRGTLVAAEQCFFSDQYEPRLLLEDYLAEKEDKFLSFDYISSANCTNENLAEWRQFFAALGIQEELRPITFDRKLTSYEAAGYGFFEKYLSATSPNGRHTVDAFLGLTTISFMQHTKSKNTNQDITQLYSHSTSPLDNYVFANFFWPYVTKNIQAEILTKKITIYWGHSNKPGAIVGTLQDNADYISWFVNNVECIPTTATTCELASNVLVDSKELTDLCSKYMKFTSLSLPKEKIHWQKIFNFKSKLSVIDYFDLLDSIRSDENNLNENLDRVQNVYSHILKEMYYWSSDERQQAKRRAKSSYLLTENMQWKLASDIYLYMEDSRANNGLNDAIPCLQLDSKNRNNLHLKEFLYLFNIKQIKMNDLKLVDAKSSPAEHFRRKLIEISPFLKKWLQVSAVSADAICTIDRKIQQEYAFIESDSLQLFYHQNFVRQTNVYFDSKHKQLYVTRPWDSETTFIDLPNKLCLLLNIQDFDKNLRFLLKGTIEEIRKHFTSNDVEIPTEKDIIILESLPKTDSVIQTKVPLAAETSNSNKPSRSVKNKQTKSIQSKETLSTTNSLKSTNPIPTVSYPFPFHGFMQVPAQLPLEYAGPPTGMWRKPTTSILDHIQLVDISSVANSTPGLFHSIPNITGECDELDLYTGRVGEEMVYQYLLNEHRDHSSSVNVKWLNEIGESHLPYDIVLQKNGKTSYIEVKTTRTYNRHTFPLSINQIETFLKLRENYFIYRVYMDEKKFVILDNIRWRLMQKEHLACLLQILPSLPNCN
ncbi:unnamed protein product [Adineta ricciae]|uniref:Protein NO VEIN C-terminal domain-containing protein n=1 Tax=Adineta ricciae TaxID=249248 RepID=A0A814FNB9_ADIRI|nr:unnamed protein product [Adineta ricciae]